MRNWTNLGYTFKDAQPMTQLLSFAREFVIKVDLGEFCCKDIITQMERENQTIIIKDFTQICSPSQVWSFKKIVIRFSPVPLIAVLSKCAGSQVTQTGLVTIAYTFSVLNTSVSVASSYTWVGGNRSSKISDVEKHHPRASQTLVFMEEYQSEMHLAWEIQLTDWSTENKPV